MCKRKCKIRYVKYKDTKELIHISKRRQKNSSDVKYSSVLQPVSSGTLLMDIIRDFQGIRLGTAVGISSGSVGGYSLGVGV